MSKFAVLAQSSVCASTATSTATGSFWRRLPVLVSWSRLYTSPADRDLVVRFPGMDQLIPNLSRFVAQLRGTVMLPGCGHWTQQERAGEVNAAMIDFLRQL